MSTDRTLVEFVAVEPIAGAEMIDRVLDLPLLSFEPDELSLSLGGGTQVRGNERTDRAAVLGGPGARGAVDVVGHVSRLARELARSRPLRECRGCP